MSEEYPQYVLFRYGNNQEPSFILKINKNEDYKTELPDDVGNFLVYGNYWGTNVSKAVAETYDTFGVVRIHEFLDIVKKIARCANRRGHAN